MAARLEGGVTEYASRRCRQGCEVGFEGVDVGDQIRVELLSVDVEKGFIDFGRVDQKRR